MFKNFRNVINNAPGAKRKMIINFLILTVLFVASMVVVSADGGFNFANLISLSTTQYIFVGIYIFAIIMVLAEAYLSSELGC